jgi:hypothetical protein
VDEALMPMIPAGAGAVMAQRREPPDALDYFPTPPWATRALFEHVLPALGIDGVGTVWEPACGEGHMAAVIGEFKVMVLGRSRSCNLSKCTTGGNLSCIPSRF